MQPFGLVRPLLGVPAGERVEALRVLVALMRQAQALLCDVGLVAVAVCDLAEGVDERELGAVQQPR